MSLRTKVMSWGKTFISLVSWFPRMLNWATVIALGFPRGSVVKNPSASIGDVGWIPGSGRSPGGGNGNPLQYSCLENPMDRGAWWATVSGGHKRLDRTEHLNNT